MKKSTLFFLVTALLIPSVVIAERPLIAKVVRVVDGDTIKIETNIRLAEIDCPETKQAGGTEARNALARAILQRRASISLGPRGRYGRFVGTVLDRHGANLNYLLVRYGYCWVYKGSKNRELIGLQEQAKKEKLGIWAGEPKAPWIWRKERRDKK